MYCKTSRFGNGVADAGCFTGNVDVVVLSFVVKVDTCVFGRLVLSLCLPPHSFIYCHICRIILSPFGTKSCSIEVFDIFVVIKCFTFTPHRAYSK